MRGEPELADPLAAPDDGAPDYLTQRAIGTTFDFLRAVGADPGILDDIPDGVTLILLLDPRR